MPDQPSAAEVINEVYGPRGWGPFATAVFEAYRGWHEEVQERNEAARDAQRRERGQQLVSELQRVLGLNHPGLGGHGVDAVFFAPPGDVWPSIDIEFFRFRLTDRGLAVRWRCPECPGFGEEMLVKSPVSVGIEANNYWSHQEQMCRREGRK